MNWKKIGKYSDFLIRITMMFSTVLVLLSFVRYPGGTFTFGALALAFILAICFNGISQLIEARRTG